tara:strand:+ start:3321 stop:3494 length:174 start_codon:yes stop_codon:yes gene_type:complete
MSHNYNAYQTIKLGKNTTEKDLYELFGDAIETVDDKGNVLPNYLKNKYNKRNGWNNN